MGTRPVKSLVFSTALPLMFSLLISSRYNVVDSVFVSKLGEDAWILLALFLTQL